MAAASKHPLDIYAWLLKGIETCESIDQAMGMRILVNIFHERYGLSYFNAYNEMNRVFWVKFRELAKLSYEGKDNL